MRVALHGVEGLGVLVCRLRRRNAGSRVHGLRVQGIGVGFSLTTDSWCRAFTDSRCRASGSGAGVSLEGLTCRVQGTWVAP